MVERSITCMVCGISGRVCPVMNDGIPVGWGAYLVQRCGKRWIVCCRLGNIVCGLWVSCGCCMGTLESESVSSFHGCPECPFMWCSVMFCVVDRILCREHSRVWSNMSDFGV